MAAVVSCLSQKGGVAKSGLARLVAREYAAAGRRVLVGDLDTLQGTSTEWSNRRNDAAIFPTVQTHGFDSVKKALKASADVELLVLDGRGFADQQTAEAAASSSAILLPTGTGIDDLRPSVRLAHELIAAGIERHRLIFVLCRAGDSARENDDARRYIRTAGYDCLPEVWPERAGYRQAHDEGRAATEARHPSLRAKAKLLASALTKTLDPLIWKARKMTDKPIPVAKPRRAVRKGAPPTPAETLGALASTIEAPTPAATDSVPAPVTVPKTPAKSKAPAKPKAEAVRVAKTEAKPASPKPKKPVSERTKPLNFRVTNEFRKAFKQAAANEDCKKVELLERMFDAWQASKAK